MMVLLALSSCKKSIIDALQPTEALLRYNKITSGTKMCSLNFHSMEFTYFGLMRRKKVWFARQTLALIAFYLDSSKITLTTFPHYCYISIVLLHFLMGEEDQIDAILMHFVLCFALKICVDYIQYSICDKYRLVNMQLTMTFDTFWLQSIMKLIWMALRFC